MVQVTSSAIKQNPWRERVAWMLAVALLSGLAFFAAGHYRAPSTGEPVRFSINPPEKTVFSGAPNITVGVPQFASSPDGRAIVFVANSPGADSMLWLRSLEQVAARPLPGTERAQLPFWSPDSRWVAFFADGKLKKVPVAAGPVQVLMDVADPFGGSWGADDSIIFAKLSSSIFRVSSGGGIVTSITKLDSIQKAHRWPQFLPDGRHFLFHVQGSDAEHLGIYAGSLDGGTPKFLVRTDGSAVYASPGYLLYVDGDTLLGQTFDAAHLELRGEPFTVAEHVGRSSGFNTAVSASSTGMLAYAAAILQRGRLTWFDRAGNSLGLVGVEGDYPDFRLSPNGDTLAVTLVDPKAWRPDIWLIDLKRGGPSRFTLTFGSTLNAAPVWSPDGARIVFRTNRNGMTELYEKSAGGGGNETPVLTNETQLAAGIGSSNLVSSDWSPDGRYIMGSVPQQASGDDLWLILSVVIRNRSNFWDRRATRLHGNFSPDGRLVAYSSNESGRFQVYVQTFPLSDRKWQVSTDGGYEPRWRSDGREIYYLSEDRKLMAVSVGAGPGIWCSQSALPDASARRCNFTPHALRPQSRRAALPDQYADRRCVAQSDHCRAQLAGGAEEMTLAAGAKLGPYEVISPAGAGGMGEVYRARDTRLDRTVAIKILPAHLSSNPEAKQRFDREARAISSLNHPNICTLYDVGHQDGIDYLVMEFLEGETLADRLMRGPLPPEQVLKYGIEICEGLEKAHRGGVTHRDLKPGNIMLTKTGAKLMDFGLAKACSSPGGASASGLTLTSPVASRPLTQEGMVIGTFQYMSPEQIEGKEADARSDIFGLGAVLYEMATGKRAFEGKTTTSVIAAILERDPPPISAVKPMFPPSAGRSGRNLSGEGSGRTVAERARREAAVEGDCDVSGSA